MTAMKVITLFFKLNSWKNNINSHIFHYKETIFYEIASIDNNYTTTVCGSYRRGADSSGDIDILITHPTYVSGSYVKEKPNLNQENLIVQSKKSPKHLLSKIVDQLIKIGFISDTISFGDTKYMVYSDILIKIIFFFIFGFISQTVKFCLRILRQFSKNRSLTYI